MSVIKLQGKTQKINFRVFQIYLIQMNPGAVLVIEKWILLVLGKVRCCAKFNVSTRINPELTKKITFWVFQMYLVLMNPGCVLVIGKWILWYWEKSIFRNFPSLNYKITGEKSDKINFRVFQIYLAQMNPGDVLFIAEWTHLELGKVYFRKFPNCHL